jgi:hypothetical protein
MTNATYTAFSASDLYQAGYSCDGHPYIGEKYYVIIENEAGRRFRHEKSFAGVEVVECEETGETNFIDIREDAKTIVADLVAKVNAVLASGKSLTSSCWFEVDPAYGSDAYVDQGTEAKRAYADRNAA